MQHAHAHARAHTHREEWKSKPRIKINGLEEKEMRKNKKHKT